MGGRTKIDWCDASWNPVTGCLHGCEYCYARRIAKRFDGHAPIEAVDECKWLERILNCEDCQKCNHVLDEPFRNTLYNGKIEPYPFGFNPTFHRYRLDEPQHWKKPRNIFVCSMADLFGDWVPDEWIRQVFEACIKAPQHRYLFLTKNPKRYVELSNDLDWWEDYFQRDNFWFGTTVTNGDMPYFVPGSDTVHTFLSIEPIETGFGEFPSAENNGWIIVGAETGRQKNKIIPEAEWIYDIADSCEVFKTPIFMKESLRDLMGDYFRQEFPWEVK